MTTVKITKDIEDLIPGFIANRRKSLEEMNTALENSDYETIKALAHKTKGASGVYGFKEAYEQCQELEKAALSRDESETKALIQKLLSYYDTVQIEFV